MKYHTFIPTILSTAILAACGGGGGGGSSTSSAPIDNAPVPTTTTVTFNMTLNQVAPSVSAVTPAWHMGASHIHAPTNDPSKSSDVLSNGYYAYSPSQIRQAYNQPALTSSSTPASLGAGQTIYILDSNDDPQVFTELADFNSQFGLPACTEVTVTSTDLGAAPVNGCTISKVYLDDNGNITQTAPTYDSGWASEIAIDTQWAHATAPYARIILIEMPDADTTTISAAITTINKMGSGVVSMSFASPEDGSESDSIFSATGMTYVAAAGDYGEQVNWPASSSKVISVGGTTLDFSAGYRNETVWDGTGGGDSLYESKPSYQSNLPGSGRHLNDLSYVADPLTGVYVVSLAPGVTYNPNNWTSMGGTSIAAPQIAGLIAVANAERADIGSEPLGDIHATIYANESDFTDIISGSDGGNCGTYDTCDAKIGYDNPSGLGSPIVNSFLSTLVAAPVEAPNHDNLTVTISDLASNFTINDALSNTVTVTVSGVPNGMTFTPSGNVVNIGDSQSASLTINVKDSNGVSTTVNMNVVN